MGNCACQEVHSEQEKDKRSRIESTAQNKRQLLDNYQTQVDDILGNERAFYSFDKSKKCFSDFQIVKKIGQGNFGTVFQVYSPQDRKNYAMKVILKSSMKDDKQKQHALNEKIILASNSNPFLLKLLYSFQDEKKLYLITEFLEGGDLYMNMKYKQKFFDRDVLFYSSEIIVALEYLHSKGIIYRDLKPENVLLTKQGHIKLADFGLSKIKNFKDQRTSSKCGTPDYIAPEIVIGEEGHNESVDLWSLGSVIYELYHGYPPFYCKDKRKQIEDSISKEVLLSKRISSDAQDFIRKLLQPNPENRIGFKGFEEIKSHPYFANIDWEKVSRGEMEPVKPISQEAVQKEIDLLNPQNKGYPSSEIDINSIADIRIDGYTYNHHQNFVQIPEYATKSQHSLKISLDINQDFIETQDNNYVKQQQQDSQIEQQVY